MQSGIVYFDEIVENIKDVTGIENMRPLYNRIRRFIFNVENDIGAGGVIVRKKKFYKIGDGMYDGKRFYLPEDFAYEYSKGSLTTGIIYGNMLQLYCDGPAELDFRYMGFLLDQNGNPFTTRIRLNAVVFYALYRLYSAQMFMKKGNMNLYLTYKNEYENAVMEARGHEAFPTAEDFANIGRTLLGGTFEAMTDCGMQTINLGCNDPVLEDLSTKDADPSCTEWMEGLLETSSIALGYLDANLKLFIASIINTYSEISSATLSEQINPEMALVGIINSGSTINATLTENIFTIACNESFTYSGGQGTFTFKLLLGEGIGMTGLTVDAYAIADRFRIEYNGVIVADSKFIGAPTNTNLNNLLALGYTEDEIDLGWENTPKTIMFDKPGTSPNFANVIVDAPLGSTQWNVKGICPKNSSIGSSVLSGELTSTTMALPSQMQGIVSSKTDTNATIDYIEAITGVLSARIISSTETTATLRIALVEYTYTGMNQYAESNNPGGTIVYKDYAGEHTITDLWEGDEVTFLAYEIVSTIDVIRIIT